jgi:hypothetical protein
MAKSNGYYVIIWQVYSCLEAWYEQYVVGDELIGNEQPNSS